MITRCDTCGRVQTYEGPVRYDVVPVQAVEAAQALGGSSGRDAALAGCVVLRCFGKVRDVEYAELTPCPGSQVPIPGQELVDWEALITAFLVGGPEAVIAAITAARRSHNGEGGP